MDPERKGSYQKSVEEIIHEMIESSEKSPYSPTQQSMQENETSFANVQDNETSPLTRQRNLLQKRCIKLRNLLRKYREENSNKISDCENIERSDLLPQENKEKFVIRTSLIHYESVSDSLSPQRRQQPNQKHLSKEYLLSDITSATISKLPPLLAPLITHRIDSSLLLPATQDERANAEIMSTSVKAAKTISKQAMAAAHLYLELISEHGSNSVGLIDVGVLSAASALIRRWGVELRGREPKYVKPKPKRKQSEIKKNARKRKSVRIQNQSQHDNDIYDTYDSSDADSNENVNQTLIVDRYDTESRTNDFLSDTRLIHDGLELASAFSLPLQIPQFSQLSVDIKEAIIDGATQGFAYTCALLAGLNGKERTKDKDGLSSMKVKCERIIQNISYGLRICITANLIDDKYKAKKAPKWKKRSIRQSHETLVLILRGLYPFLCLKVDIPNGQLGKTFTHEYSLHIINQITQKISEEVRIQVEMKGSILGTYTNKKTPSSTLLKDTPHSMSSTIATPSTKKKVRISIAESIKKELSCPSSEPRLKTNTPRPCRTKSPFRSNGNSETSASTTSSQSRPLLSALLGMMQKMSTSEGLEKARQRARIISALKRILPSFLRIELEHFLKFIVSMCRSRVICHRLFASEFIGEVWMEDWILDEFDESKRSIGVIFEDARSTIRTILIRTLVERVSDKTSVVRARAIHSLSQSLKRILTMDEYPVEEVDSSSSATTESTSQKYFETLQAINEPLLQSLRNLAFSDEKATVRRAAVNALMNFFILNLNSLQKYNTEELHLTDHDIGALSVCCSDHSVATRNAAIEALTKILQCPSLREHSSALATLTEASWARSAIPLVKDAETSCINKIKEAFIDVVLRPIIDVGNNGANDLTTIQKYKTAWNVLYFISYQVKGTGAARCLTVILSKIFEDCDMSQTAVMKPLLNEIIRKATATLGIDLSCKDDDIIKNDSMSIDKDMAWFQDPDLEKQRFGAWSFLFALSSCRISSTKHSEGNGSINLGAIMKKSRICTSFLALSYERLHKVNMLNNNALHPETTISYTIQACLGTIARLGTTLPNQHARHLFELLKKQTLSCEIPIHIIDGVIPSLISLSETICDDDIVSECKEWINEIYSKSQITLESFISNWKDDFNIGKEKDETIYKVQRAIFFSGEVSLVGFHPEEEGSTTKLNDSFEKKPCNSLMKNIRGLHVKPSQKLMQLIQTILPPTLPAMKNTQEVRKNPPSIRAQAYVALGKFCLRNEKLAKDNINIFSREIQEVDDLEENAAVKSNALMILGDLCVRYTNLVDMHLPVLAACMQLGTNSSNKKIKNLSTPSVGHVVRKHSVLIVASLLLQDYIKWRGFLVFRFLVATTDADTSVANIARMTLCGPIISKYPSLFADNFVETLFVLNGCRAHPIYSSITEGDNGRKDDGCNGLILSGTTGKSRRHQIYGTMLSSLSDESKICVTARLVKEILEGALQTRGDLQAACTKLSESDKLQPFLCQRHFRAQNVIIDTFAVLTSSFAKIAHPMDETDEGTQNTTTALQIKVAKGKLLSKISQKHLIETVVPILCRLKITLESTRSPLLSHLMSYLVDIFRRFKEEVKDCLAGDPTLLMELEYDTKQFKKNTEVETKNREDASQLIEVSLIE